MLHGASWVLLLVAAAAQEGPNVACNVRRFARTAKVRLEHALDCCFPPHKDVSMDRVAPCEAFVNPRRSASAWRLL